MRVLVTGGGGFLGSHLARRLLAEGHAVSALGRRHYPCLPPAVTPLKVDICDREQTLAACRGFDAVFHAAAVPGLWGPRELFYGVNVEGTRHVLEGCQRHGAAFLIYTSSPSVVYNESDLAGVNETAPYPADYTSVYAETKAIAERLVMAADGKEGLRTVALRPHLIWGPGDAHLIPRLLRRARAGKLARVGEGRNLVDLVYIDNAVEAHICALRTLAQAPDRAGGKCYFVSDGQPVNLWEWIDALLRDLGIAPPRRRLSYAWGRRIGAALEVIHAVFGLEGEPRLTRFLAGQLATSHYFDISRAKVDLGYGPVVSPEEGRRRLLSYLAAHPDG